MSRSLASSGAEGTFLRVPRLAFRRLDDHTVIVDPRRHKVHLLDLTGSRIWELLERRRSLDELVAELEREGPFEADAQQITGDVAAFVADLVQSGLVVAGEPAGTGEP